VTLDDRTRLLARLADGLEPKLEMLEP